jgi:hypothetical protein
MKTEEAIKIIKLNERKPRFTKKGGFMVSFEKKEGHILASHHFPDKHTGEPLIRTEEEAWNLAKRFATSTDDSYVNIYVTDSEWRPVKGYYEKTIRRY